MKYDSQMKKLSILLILIQTYACVAFSQVTVDATIDSTRIYIGEQTGITLQVSADAGKTIELPHYDSLAQIVPGVEVVNMLPTDTDRINDGKRIVLTRKYIVTSFDSALYYLPPMKVNVDGKEYESKNLALKVYTFDVDTLHTDSICPSKAELAPPFTWDDWKPVLWLSLLLILLLAALVYMAIRLAKNKPILRRINLRQRIAPHKLAMQKIEQIREDKLVQSEDSKEYYTQLTEALRQYISERFGFNAMEMTSTEIIEHLERDNDREALAELNQLFQTADLVKFAKYTTLINENDRNLITAVEYINKTKIEEEVSPQPKEIVVEEKRSKVAKAVLISIVCLLGLACVAILIYMIYRLYYLFI